MLAGALRIRTRSCTPSARCLPCRHRWTGLCDTSSRVAPAVAPRPAPVPGEV